MLGRADDAMLFCLIAAALVVLAHGIDAVGSRRDDNDRGGWGHSLSLALCGLAVGMLIVGAMFARSGTDLLVTLATSAAVAVSALPLIGLTFGDGTRERPSNPWDRAYRVRPARVAQLLSPMTGRASRQTTPDARRRSAPRGDEGAREGVVVPPQSAGRTVPGMGRPSPGSHTDPTALDTPTSRTPRTGSTAGPRGGAPAEPDRPRAPQPATPDVYEAEETLNDVSEVVGDLGRLLGLSPRNQRRR